MATAMGKSSNASSDTKGRRPIRGRIRQFHRLPRPTSGGHGRWVHHSMVISPKRSHSGNRSIPIFYGRGYDGNLAARTMQARSPRKNPTTQMWKSRLDLAKIVRRKIGWRCGESEARNTTNGQRTWTVEPRPVKLHSKRHWALLHGPSFRVLCQVTIATITIKTIPRSIHQSRNSPCKHQTKTIAVANDKIADPPAHIHRERPRDALM
jgi:hypothetical protein